MNSILTQCRYLLSLAEPILDGLDDSHRALEPQPGAKTAGWLIGHLASHLGQLVAWRAGAGLGRLRRSFSMTRQPPISALFRCTTLFRSSVVPLTATAFVPPPLRREASRPQLKRDPLGGD